MTLARCTPVPIALLALVLGACSNDPPPTITPAPPASVGREVEIPVNPPPGAQGELLAPVAVPPANVDALISHRDSGSLYSLDVPQGWMPQQQPISQDVRVGTLFASPEGNGFVTVTQFDNGQRPAALGTSINQILELTGVMKLPDFVELDRASVIEREGDAMRVELAYTRSDGVPMRSLVLFQIDGTALSMVNASVESGSWGPNESRLHDVLASYKAPAAPAP